MTRAEFGRAVELISNRRVDMRPLLTASYPVEQAVEAFQFAGDKAQAMKVQLSLPECNSPRFSAPRNAAMSPGRRYMLRD